MTPTALARRVTRQSTDAVKHIVTGLFEHNSLDAAAAMSFYFFLGVIPLLAFAGLVVSEVVYDHRIDDITGPILRVMPKAAAEMIAGQLREISATPLKSIAPLSLIGFLSVTSSGVHNLMDVFEVVAKAPPRSWWKQRVIALAGIVGLLFVLAGIAWVIILIGYAFDTTNVEYRGTGTGVVLAVRRFLLGSWSRLGALSIFTALAACMLALFFQVGVVHPDRSRRRIWPGTILGIVVWLVISWGFGMYVRTMGDYAVYYGGLATVAVFLLWLYLTSLALLIGVELNAYLERVPPRFPEGGGSRHEPIEAR